jgi:hypothetical protein
MSAPIDKRDALIKLLRAWALSPDAPLSSTERGSLREAVVALLPTDRDLGERLRARGFADVPLDRQPMNLRPLLAASEKQTSNPDTARLDYLAEVTNVSALSGCGAMLSGDQVRKLEKTAIALSSRYELHRRTHDTPQAFRLAVDDAMKEGK